MDVLGYAIEGVLNSETKLDRIVIKTNLGHWHLIVFFLKKMIPIEIQYKTYNSKHLVIVKAFKIWRHYLKSCKHKILVFIKYNNFYHFMDIKSLSFRQVY